MTGADAMRASDADRERVVRALQEQVGEGRLTLSEFEQRTESAYAAKTIGQLRELTRDLPVDVFPYAFVQAPWQRPFAMPPESWSVQRFPLHRPRRPHPVLMAVMAVIGLMVLADVVGAVLWGVPLVFPVLLVAFMLLRITSGRRGYPHR